MENDKLKDKYSIEYKIKSCLENYSYLKDFELTDEEKSLIEEDGNFIYLYNKSFSDSEIAFYNSLRKIFSNDKSETFNDIDESIREKYTTLKHNVSELNKKFINKIILHTDKKHFKHPYKNFDEIYNNIIHDLFDLFYDLTDINFIDSKDLNKYHKYPIPSIHIKELIIEYINKI